MASEGFHQPFGAARECTSKCLTYDQLKESSSVLKIFKPFYFFTFNLHIYCIKLQFLDPLAASVLFFLEVQQQCLK